MNQRTFWECEFFFVRTCLDSTVELAIKGGARRDVLVVREYVLLECRATVERIYVSESSWRRARRR
jgi:hypothetical protein